MEKSVSYVTLPGFSAQPSSIARATDEEPVPVPNSLRTTHPSAKACPQRQGMLVHQTGQPHSWHCEGGLPELRV
jgi:hypothetical protein